MVATLLVVFYLHRFQILSRDLKVMSRPLLMSISFLLVAISVFVATNFLLSTSIPGRDLMLMLRPFVTLVQSLVVPTAQK